MTTAHAEQQTAAQSNRRHITAVWAAETALIIKDEWHAEERESGHDSESA